MPASIKEAEQITLTEACKVIPSRPHINTVRRWCDRGFRGIQLESWRCGNRRVTSIPAIDRFIVATTGLEESNSHRTSSALRQAEARLDEMGVK